jgi:hypothetical protein
VIAFQQPGQDEKAAGYLGEALLRLMGVSVQVIAEANLIAKAAPIIKAGGTAAEDVTASLNKMILAEQDVVAAQKALAAGTGTKAALELAEQAVEDATAAAKETITKNVSNLQLIKIRGGGDKEVFEMVGVDDHVLALLKEGKDPQKIADEIAALKQLKELGIPAVEVRIDVTKDGQPGFIMERLEQGSKDVVRTLKGTKKVVEVGTSKLLNERGIQDLENIKQMMIEKKVRIADLQFLIASDGQVVIADPIDVSVGKGPSKINLKTINRLIDAARRNLGQ